METVNKKKKALLFGGTDGHGITMTVISEKNLSTKYTVERVCRYQRTLPQGNNIPRDALPKDCGTSSPEFFWGSTFLTYDYIHLERGDLVVVVDIPLPLKQRLGFSAAEDAIRKIRELTDREIRVILIDHHKRAITHYGNAIKSGAELIFSIGAEQYCHYGRPDEFSRFWGARGAICDRDTSMLPVEDDEITPFQHMEQDAAWLDKEKENLEQLILKIMRDDRHIPSMSVTSEDSEVHPSKGNVSYIEKLKPSTGFKQLDGACAVNHTSYGVGIVTDCTAVLVINYWKTEMFNDWKKRTLPVALKLPRYLGTAGHDTALVISLDSSDCRKAKERMHEIIEVLNSDRIEKTEWLVSEADAIDYFAQVFRTIPIAYNLTMHGWNHVETVIANTQLLGSISNLPNHEQTLLNWSALFHDIGNGAYASRDEYGLDVESEKEARDKHEHYTVQILRKMQENGLFENLIPEQDFDIICEICAKHRKKTDLPKDPHVRELCSLLRLADALDKTKSRARQNDNGLRYSEVKKMLEQEKNFKSIQHWEGQRAIDSIRLQISRNHIIFEFLVTDREKADFIIDDFKKELEPLTEIIPPWEINVISL